MSSKKESTATPEYIFDTKCKLNGLCCKIFMAHHNTYLHHNSNLEYETIGEARYCGNILTHFFTEHNNKEEIKPLLKEIEQKMELNGYTKCCICETAYKPNEIYNDILYDLVANDNYKIEIVIRSARNRRYRWCKNLNTTE